MSVILNIVSEFNSGGIKQAQRQFQQLEKTSDKVAFAMKRSMVPATAALTTLAVVAFKATKMASDLNEETSKAKQIFGDASDSILDFSKTASSKIGQSRTEALKAAGTFGVLGQAAGLTGTDLTKMSIEFTKLASDLASFNNTSPEDAVLALGAGLRGEAEPLRRYGVLLDDATLRQKALEIGLIKTTKQALTPQNKSLAAQAVILEETALQQGNFALTAEDAANQQRTFTAKLKDLQTQMGTLFLPVLKNTLDTFNDYADVLIYLTTNTDKAKDSTGKWLDRFVKLAVVVLPFAQVMKGLGIVVGKVNEYVGNQADALKQNERATSRVTIKTREMAGFQKLLQTNLDATTISTEKATAANKKKADALAKTKDAAKKAAQAIKDELNAQLDDATTKLEAAQSAFNDFAKTVGNAVTETFNFGQAQSEAAGNVADLQNALDVTGKPLTFLDSLEAQAKKAQNFGVLVNRLIAGGLSETALSQVLAAGTNSGTLIAEEILGSADGILRTNALTDSMTTLANQLGTNAANKFYSAGVTAARSFLSGIQQTLGIATPEVNVPSFDFAQLAAGITVGGLGTLMADGGVVTRATTITAGEAGPEAIIPLDRMKDFGMGGGMNITVQAGLISTPDQIGQQIIEAIQRAQRRSGQVFAAA
jgi:hypothetical protein